MNKPTFGVKFSPRAPRQVAMIARMMKRTLTLLTALLLPLAARAEPAPQRIASFNLCADQLVVALADPEQIAGLSPYAADPALSIVADQARAFRRLDWQAESTITLSPDLVLVGPSDRSVTRRLLNSLRYRVVEVDLVTDLDAARRQILQIAALLGHPARGEQLAAELDRARARLRALARTPYTSALVVERGGYTAGPESLAAALVAEAGLAPPAGTAGYGGFISLERLVMLHPDLLLLKDPPRVPTDQGAIYFTHPALAALYPPERRIALPARYTLCGGPAVIAALDYMASVMTRLASMSPPTGR
jgi:iron complex transport system substrate-binding protein